MTTERKDHVMLTVRNDKQSMRGKTLAITRPDQILHITDKQELDAQLEHYSRPFLTHLLPDTTFARRHHLLYVRPALRYYCARFGVKVPSWLENDDAYEQLPDDEKVKLFGTTKLRYNGKFAPLNKPATRGQVTK